MNLLHLLANDGFICVNKHIIRKLGLVEAVLIGELASIYTYNENKGVLEDGWFYATIERIEENTGLSEYKQQQTINKLCDLGILQQKLMGMPRRRFLTFNAQKLFEVIVETAPVQLPNFSEQAPENSETSSQILPEQAPENSEAIYNNNYNNTNKNKNNTLYGEDSNKNNILGNNQISQPSQPVSHAPRVKAPVIKASAKIPTEIQAKLNEWNNYPETKKALEDYCLFCLDTYNQPKATLKHKINQICKMANNVPKGIEIICEYNITGNYKTVFKPSYYNKVLSESSVVSKAYEGDFVRDEDGNIEEIW